jgi:hypothetical protein
MRQHLLEPVGLRRSPAWSAVLGAIPTMDERRSSRCAPASALPLVRSPTLAEVGPSRPTPSRGRALDDARGRRRLPPPSGRRPPVGAAGSRKYYELAPSDWPGLRRQFARRLGRAADPRRARSIGGAGGVPAPAPRFRRRRQTLIKPLCWQGDMSFGPPRDGRATFRRLDDSPRWARLGPAKRDRMRSRRTSARTGQRRTTTSTTGSGRDSAPAVTCSLGRRAGTQLVAVDVDGSSCPGEDVDELMTTQATDSLRLLPGDQWAMGPARRTCTSCRPARRAPVTARRTSWSRAVS